MTCLRRKRGFSMSSQSSNSDHSDGAPRLLNYRQASAYLALSERKLWALAASAEIPTCRIGRCVRFDIEDLRLFIERTKR